MEWNTDDGGSYENKQAKMKEKRREKYGRETAHMRAHATEAGSYCFRCLRKIHTSNTKGLRDRDSFGNAETISS